MAMPRVHPSDEGINIEFTGQNGFSLADSSYISSMGHEVSVTRGKARFGRIHAVMKDPDGNGWFGVADPDWEGSADSPN